MQMRKKPLLVGLSRAGETGGQWNRLDRRRETNRLWSLYFRFCPLSLSLSKINAFSSSSLSLSLCFSLPLSVAHCAPPPLASPFLFRVLLTFQKQKEGDHSAVCWTEQRARFKRVINLASELPSSTGPQLCRSTFRSLPPLALLRVPYPFSPPPQKPREESFAWFWSVLLFLLLLQVRFLLSMYTL